MVKLFLGGRVRGRLMSGWDAAADATWNPDLKNHPVEEMYARNSGVKSLVLQTNGRLNKHDLEVEAAGP